MDVITYSTGPKLASPLRRVLTLAPATLLAFVLCMVLSSSALARHAAEREGAVIEGVSYGPSSEEIANVYPSTQADSPLVVLVHGGGWRKQGAIGRFELESHSLQAEGSTVVEINYDQDSPETPAFPMEPDDVIAATHWAVAHAAQFNAGSGKLVLLGGSAGGNLVAIAAEELAVSNPGLVTGVVTLSGPTNFVSLMGQLEENAIGNENFNTSVHRALGYEEPESEPFPLAYAERWSPALHAPSANCPRWLIFNSSHEFIPLTQATGLDAALVKAKCSATLEVVPGSEHAFAYFHEVKPRIFSFIKSL